MLVVRRSGIVGITHDAFSLFLGGLRYGALGSLARLDLLIEFFGEGLKLRRARSSLMHLAGQGPNTRRGLVQVGGAFLQCEQDSVTSDRPVGFKAAAGLREALHRGLCCELACFVQVRGSGVVRSRFGRPGEKFAVFVQPRGRDGQFAGFDGCLLQLDHCLFQLRVMPDQIGRKQCAKRKQHSGLDQKALQDRAAEIAVKHDF